VTEEAGPSQRRLGNRST